MEVIIFSNTKDYKSLSRALGLHVSAFITQEDFSEDSLMNTLDSVLSSFNNQIHQAGIIKRQLLRDIIKGKKPTSDDIYHYFDIDDPYASFVAFYIRRDAPVHILCGYDAGTNYYAVNWRGNPYHPDLEYIATVNLYMHSWCTLIRVKKIPSTLNLYNLCWKTAAMLQQSFSSQINDTVSIAFSDIFQDFENFPQKVDTLQQILDQQNYNGRSRIASYRDPLPVFTDSQEFMNIWRPRVSQSLYENDLNATCENIEKMFMQLKQSGYSRSSCLEPVCGQLIEDIDNFCRNYSLPNVNEMSINVPDRPVCYSLQDVITAYKKIVRRTFEMLKKNSITAIDNQKILEIIKYIEDNCKTANVSTVAEHFHMNVDYLSHFFKNKTDTNLSTLITEKKVNRSKSLLLQKKYKIKEIAEMVGFNSSQYFSTVFFKVVGMSPKEFVDSQKN